VLGHWLRDSGRRADVVVLTKGAHQDADRRRVTPPDISADLLESLDVLGAGSIEIYMLHRDDPSQPIGPLVEVLNEHRRAGRIGAFGCSNWSTTRLDEANEYARTHGLEAFSCRSPGLSLAQQREPPWPDCVSADDAGSRAWYERTGMPVFAWSSQAAGFFAGVDGPDVVRVYGSEGNLERLRRATELGERIGHTENEVALAWVDVRTIHPSWGDPFVEEWRAFHRHVTEGSRPKTSPADFREDLELCRDLAGAMAAGR